MRVQARQLARLALAFTGVTREETGAPSELPTHDLGHAVARLAVSLDRLAQPWSTTDHTDDAERVLIGERPLTDALSVFLFGDQVLDCFARVELSRRSQAQRGWAGLVEQLDKYPDDPMTAGVRCLNLALGLARDLLAEHYAPEHHPTASYGGAGDVMLGRIAVPGEDGEPYASAVALLREALGVPDGAIAEPVSEYHDLAWQAMDQAPALDFQRAGLVRKAFALGGAHSVPVPWIVDWLLAILRQHAQARGISVTN